MPFLDHLEELRWRLLKSLLAVGIGTAVGWFAVQQLDIVALLKAPIAPFLSGGKLAFTSPTEPLVLTLKLAFVTGILLGSPVVAYQLWAFLAPALYPREKRVIAPAFTAGLVLFTGGAVACYRWVLPAALTVLFAFQREDLAAVITIDRYFSFATQLIVAFGIIAELPLVVTILAAFGLVTPATLTRHRRYAIVVAAIVAAFLTPPDALSMLMMLVPLLLLYEVSILCAWLVTRRRGKAGVAGLVLWLALSGWGGGEAAAQQRATPPDSVRAFGGAFVVGSMDEAAALVERLAPEHL
jgi:sec-independent protein translocase protein TatC